MAVGAEKRTSRCCHLTDACVRTQPTCAMTLKLEVPATQNETADWRGNYDNDESNERRAEVSMGPAMKYVGVANQADQWLYIHSDLGDSKHEDAEVPSRYSLECQRWTHVKWCEWHGVCGLTLALSGGRKLAKRAFNRPRQQREKCQCFWFQC